MKSMWTDGKPATVKRGTLHRSGRKSFIILCLLLVSVPGLSSATPSRADINERFTMDEFRDEAISSNLELMNKRNDVELSGIEVKKARAQRLPTINSTLSYTLMGNPRDPVYIYTEDLAGLLPDMTGTGGGPDRIKVMDGGEPGYFKFEMELQQPLFTWGRLAVMRKSCG